MFIMGSTRRGFTSENKDEAVKLVINTGRTVATVVRELGLKEATLGRWVHDFRARAAAGEGGQGGLSELFARRVAAVA
jgi:transposase